MPRLPDPSSRTPADPDVDVAAEADGPWLLVGLDGEMSSAELATGGKLIQAGLAAWVGEPGGRIETFTSLIRQTDMEWSPRAAAVHNIPRSAVDSAPPAVEVDAAAYAWLVDHGAVEGRRVVVPVGLNVGSFDMPFFRQALPRTSSLISRRAVDLNALCFTYAGWDPSPHNAARDFAGWKRSMKTAVNTDLRRRGVPVAEHDAGYDAAQALLGWWWLRNQFVDLSRRAAVLDERLDRADPLRAVLGDGLLDRLASVDRGYLSRVVAALPDDVPPRRWFGRPNALLGETPLSALSAGRFDEVLAAAGG